MFSSNFNDNSPRVRVAASTAWYSDSASFDEITAAVKKSLGFLEKPLTKCIHCGQWGAAYCACRHCGAPIDPKE